MLGSFPSVKSRKIQFYYGNKQNRFWKTVCGFFGEEIPESTDGKKEFLHRRKIALWDMVTECEIEGSADSAVKNASVADLGVILRRRRSKRYFSTERCPITSLRHTMPTWPFPISKCLRQVLQIPASTRKSGRSSFVTYSEFLEELTPYGEADFAKFQQRIINSPSQEFLGIRTPTMRLLAKRHKNDPETLFPFPTVITR